MKFFKVLQLIAKDLEYKQVKEQRILEKLKKTTNMLNFNLLR